MQIFGEILGHAFGQHGDQRPVAFLRHLPHLADEIVDLQARGPYLDRRIDQAGRADDLLDEDAAGFIELPWSRRCRNRDALRTHGVPFLETQRPVVHAGGQAETVFGERRLAAEVAAEHAAELRDRDVAFVAEHQCVVGHIFEQRRRRLARLAAGEIARIVFDAGTSAGRFHHFQVEDGALLEPLRLQQAAGGGKLIETLPQLVLDAGDGLDQRGARRDIVRIGVDLHEFQLVGLLTGKRVHLLDLLDLVAEQMNAPGAVFVVRREDVDRVAAHAE